MKVRLIKLFNKIKLVVKIARNTPKIALLVILQLVAGLSNVVGLPLLLPVLDLMKQENMNQLTREKLNFFFIVLERLSIPVSFQSMLILAAGTVLIAQMLTALSNLINQFVQIDIAEDNRKKLFKNYFLAKWDYLNELKSGEMNFSVIKEAEQASLAHQNSVRVLMMFFQVLVLFIIACKLSPIITFTAAIAYGCVAVFGLWNSNKIYHLANSYNKNFNAFSNDLSCLLNNKKLIKVSPLRTRYSHRINGHIESLTSNFKKQGMRHILQGMFSTNFIFLFLVIIMYFHKTLNIESSTLFVTLLIFFRISPMATELSASFARLDSVIPFYESFNKKISDLGSFVENTKGRGPDSIGGIEVKNLSFSYNDNDGEVLKDLSLDIEEKKITAIMGASGTGKSTLLDLLLSLRDPKAGSIVISGSNYSLFDKNIYRDKIAYVGQHITLIEGSLRENLSMGKKNLSDERMIVILRKLGLGELYDKLPNGLDSDLGENGSFISGGQKQRIAIARALLEECDLLVLDEISSALDYESLHKLKMVLSDLKGKQTIVIVTHDPKLSKVADRLYYLKNGFVEKEGRPLEVLAGVEGISLS